MVLANQVLNVFIGKTCITNRSSAFRACGPPPDPKRLRLFGPLNSNVMCKKSEDIKWMLLQASDF